jgi:hypothetical protein
MSAVQSIRGAGADFLTDGGYALLVALGREPEMTLAQATRPAARVDLGRVHGGQGNDNVSGDFPLVNGQPTFPAEWGERSWARNTARNMSRLTDEVLISRFREEYELASHYRPVTARQLEKFLSGDGGIYLSGPGSELSTLVAESSEGQALGATLAARVQDSAERQLAQGGTVDVGRLGIELDASDRLRWGMNPTSPLWGLVGSTDGLDVDLKDGRYDPSTRRLTGTLSITVIGLSNQDNDSVGQIAMWLLQHQRGYQSFENQIVYEVPLDVTLRAPAPRFNPLQDHPVP